jgi:gamma-glutamyl-gamma-aminobutyrate hydrolase PuuD
MKRIAVTQRVVEVEAYDERRDALDQRWIDFLLSINAFPVLVPNNLDFLERLLATEDVEGILLTGGNSLSKYGGDAPERDKVEESLLEWANSRRVPVLGVCRGMQLIQDFFGNQLELVSGHVAERHSLVVAQDTKLSESLSKLGTVNAYHEFGSRNSVDKIVVSATSEDGVIMAIEHRELDVFGVMWHSERECPFVEEEKEIFRLVFGL